MGLMARSGKAKQQRGKSAAVVTERKLDSGWAAAPGVRVRQALPADMGAVRELATLAGVTLEDVLAESVVSGVAGLALRAGLSEGQEGFNRHIAEQFIAHPDDPLQAYLSAALVLVAYDREHSVVGTVVAYPPASIAQIHLDGARRRGITDPRELNNLMMLGAIGLAKVKALAVAEPARGRNVGGSLLLRCRQVFFACGYAIVYGQMPPTPGLDAFYRRNGFEVLDQGEGLDLWPVFGVHSRVDTDPGERFFIRYRPGS
jgi:GNAT superfamily N-acetyltransferase